MISLKHDSGKIHIAYVGLNGESRAVLFFNLVVPKNDKDEIKSLKLWNNFFEKTKELPIPLFIKAKGQELHIGYTIVDVAKRKIKVTAEKRKSDNKIRVIMIPEDITTKFEFEEISTCEMGLDWHFKEPLVKIKGMYSVENNWVNVFQTTSVLLKEVDVLSEIPSEPKNVFYKDL